MEGSDRYPNKRLRTQTPAPSPPPSTKGKEKMEESDAAAADGGGAGPAAVETCGICLSDGWSSIRGHIDSCDHFFCYICIMEWAKVESRCPMCKRRFRSIRRPPARGVFPCERIVEIPVRDQVDHPLDPYEQVNCSICQSSADEELLLLCDLCDSAAHTYCAGLGAAVPEGDWYCPDCTISRDEHTKSQTDADCRNQLLYRNLVVVGISESPPVSVSEIVSDGIATKSSQSFSTIQDLQERCHGDRPPSTNTSQRNFRVSMLPTEQSIPSIPAGRTVSSTISSVGITSEPPVKILDIVSDGNACGSSQGFSTIREQRNNNRLPSRDTSQRESQDSVLHREQSSLRIPVGETISSTRAAVDKGARTLHRCRHLQGRIRTLRENWNALRAGSLAFPSSLVKGTGAVYDRKQKVNKMSLDTSRLSGSSASVTGVQMCADPDASNEKHKRTGSRDVDRAWKMMEIAKSVKGNHRGTISNHSLNSCSKKKFSKGDENLHSSSFVPKGSISADKVSAHTESVDSSYPYLKTVHNNCKPQDCKKQKADMKTTEEQRICSGPQNTLLSGSGYSEVPSTTRYRVSPKDRLAGKEGPAPQQLLRKLSISFDESDAQAYPCSAGCSLPKTSSLSFTKPVEFSSSKVERREANQGAQTNADKSLIRNNISNTRAKGTKADESSIIRNGVRSNSAKDEVQSLVKLNLKLLRRDHHLGAVQFKEVARVATHTILAACGLEHSKSSARPFVSSACTHSELIKQLRRSNLMPNSCRECFYTFVKNVVDSALSEKYL